MLTALLAIAVIQLILIVILALTARRGKGGVGIDEVRAELAARERTQLDALERARGALEEAMQRGAKLHSDAQREATAQLVEQARATQAELQKTLAEGFINAQQRIAAALGEARKAQDERLDKVDATLKAFSDTANKTALEQRQALAETLANTRKTQDERLDKVDATLKAFSDTAGKTALEQRQALTDSLTALRDRVGASLQELRAENSAQLDKIRGTVEEKLQTALEKRLTESFKLVGAQLEQVARGLGEMQQLAAGVGDLKRVLTNVKSRGTFGEAQLGALLEQALTRQQYEANVATIPGSTERVEFAIRLPGRAAGEETVWLPIDAKFPQEDYLRLQQAYENASAEEAEAARKALRARLLDEAQKIAAKYVSPPHTTDFALMFLPTEGLYAEALRIPGLTEELQTRHRVVIAGPTTVYAILNALQLGFRTLAIEKRSSEVWKILAAVKLEFEKFGDSIEAVSKSLAAASNNIGKVGTRARAMERKLKDVESLPAADGAPMLDMFANSGD